MILCICPNPSIDTLVTVDDLSPGKVHRAKREERFPGGKGVHVALAAEELGSEVTLLAFWAGPSGTWIRQQCEKKQIRCAGPQISGWSRSCITFKSRGVYDETELLGVGPKVSADEMEQFRQTLAVLASGASVVTLSGSWPPGAPDDAYARLLAILNGQRKPAMLDCTGKPFELALPLRPNTVHLNRHEAQALTGLSDPMQAARMLAESCGVAVVTGGAEGAWFCGEGKMLHVVCPIEARYSSVGSGDCLLAGLAVAREQGKSLGEAAILATACGAANCLRPELGMLRREDVMEVAKQVILEELK